MKVAIQGCCHGELDQIYASLPSDIELLLICGDFQSIRNSADLSSMSVPQKYLNLGHFYEYYRGSKAAPVLTIFIGGNHEASNYLSELFHGGWVCHNIYYLGHAGVVNFRGLRIGGLSGIYKHFDYQKGFFENPPYTHSTVKSVYHVRKYNVDRLSLVHEPLDVFMSHDWPTGIYNHGNKQELLARKKHFREEVKTNSLGSPPLEYLLKRLKPSHWFSAHLHVKFEALFVHSNDGNPDEIDLDLEDEDEEAAPKRVKQETTQFLALDKCLPGRHFLQVMDINVQNKNQGFQYDPEWLSIVRATAHLYSKTLSQPRFPSASQLTCLIQKEREWIDSRVQKTPGFLDIPFNFVMSAPPHDPQNPDSFNPGTCLSN